MPLLRASPGNVFTGLTIKEVPMIINKSALQTDSFAYATNFSSRFSPKNIVLLFKMPPHFLHFGTF